MRDSSTSAPVIRREDYSPPPFWIDSVDLSFDLDPAKTRVLNRMTLRRNPAAPEASDLRLEGDGLNLARVLLNGQASSFKMDGQALVLQNLPAGDAPFELEIFTTCAPEKNTALMGLYVSQGTFFTQCEAEGFRRITYFLDRPDVMASYRVTLRGDKRLYPVLLSNGNLVESGTLDDGRGYAVWHDPHKKPCYLFALVAGNLVCREQSVRTRLGKEHLLQVYVRPGDLDKTEHAMHSLMNSIDWDERRFNLSLDLDRFMIVATSDFNMGAMENKGLNIFNTKFVLASAASATDVDFANVEAVVGHEYFHNWTGNRVTCRDWFQLSLKEGLTVFRDQEFSMDMSGSVSARAVKRIEDVRLLRSVQFAEDASPMAHPVRPDEYVEINNFYTVTIYEKGAEVVRMMQTLVGVDGFKKGMALYFERFDGQAVTCDDFVEAIADANADSLLKQHLAGFKRWYAQAGTPRVQVKKQVLENGISLRFTQSCPATPGQPHKEPFVIPVQLGLVDSHSGAAIEVATPLLCLTETTTELVLEGVASSAVPSLLRGFSAPVILQYDYSYAELLTLFAHDADPFNRWDAGQQLLLLQLLAAIQTDDQATATPIFDAATVAALQSVLHHPELDAAFKELAISLPSEGYIADQLANQGLAIDPERIHQVREAAKLQLASQLAADWQWAFTMHQVRGAYQPNANDSGKRALANHALQMLCLAESQDAALHGKTYQRVKSAGNMTDRFAALSALVASDAPLKTEALAYFYALFKDDALVLDKWFALQASYCKDASAARGLMRHPDFTLVNPNRARSLIFSFCNANLAAFHKTDASGYVFWSECMLELDAINPQVAARLARSMDKCKKLAEPHASGCIEAIQRVLAKSDLSADTREILEKTLAP